MLNKFSMFGVITYIMRYLFVYDIIQYYGTIDDSSLTLKALHAYSTLPYPILPFTLGHYSLSSQVVLPSLRQVLNLLLLVLALLTLSLLLMD